MRKALPILMFLSGTMPLCLGITCLFAYPQAIAMLKLTDGPGVSAGVILFGVCLVPMAVMQFLAGYWIWKKNNAGVILARILGLLMLIDGILLYAILHRADLAMADIIKGVLISMLAFTTKTGKGA